MRTAFGIRSVTVRLAPVAALGLLLATPAEGASLQPVSNWGVAGLPSDVTMSVYVPDRVATNPPILTLIHYCGGTASLVFGQAQNGGLVAAADQYGFIIVVPSSGRCWDVESDKAWTRNGSGDSHAIKQMVTYAIGKYAANADRVYSTGDSSGAMMTELLLAVYPDIFKAGAAFAGMPAGCRGTNESGTSMGYSGACAGGSVTHTPQDWGDIARKMYGGYTGHRPRVQLFHGDADTTIRYPNFTEALKEWQNVLGLASAPTSTDMNVPLGNHMSTRQRWQNACGFVVLDGFTSLGGDHGPSDALFKSTYVIPFLGLDKTGAVDPEIQQCGNGGVGGNAGGNGGAGGRGGSGGGAGGRGGGAGGGGRGGAGNPGTGGTVGSGGGIVATGGAGTGGTVGSGGMTGSGGAPGSGGAVGTGGLASTGGASVVTGSGGHGTGGASASGGSAGTGSPDAGTDTGSGAGCNCSLGAAYAHHRSYADAALGLMLVLSAFVRRRRKVAETATGLAVGQRRS